MSSAQQTIEAFAGTERFSVIMRLGEGGMGVVYLAHDRDRGAPVALKTLPAPEPSKILRLKDEFRALAGVSHPNLVKLHELVSDGARWFFTMEYVEGVDFLSYVRDAHGRALAETVSFEASVTLPAMTLPVEPDMTTTRIDRAALDQTRIGGRAARGADDVRLRKALRELAAAITALHEQGILHLDVKPPNVLVTAAGRVVVLDFGLVARVAGTDGRAPAGSEVVAGTPAYMAPEQAQNSGVCEASDWYAVGTMLYEALAGRLPFEGTAWGMLHQKLASEPLPPRAHNPLAPPDLDDLCSRLLRRLPGERPTSAEILRRLGADPPRVELTDAPEIDRVSAPGGALIGRDTELAALRGALAAVERGAGATALVHGASGMGKTALVEAVLAEARASALVLRGRCYERESVPYKAFDSLIDALYRRLAALPPAEVTALLPAQAAALARLFPVLAQLPGVAARVAERRGAPDAHEHRRQGFTALRELLERLAARGPLALFIDDLQWGDVDSAALLAEILRPPAPPLLLLGAYRDEDAARSPLLQRLLAAPRSEVGEILDVRVGPLAPEHAEELALACMSASDPDRAARAALIAAESGGHPYFVAELARGVESGRAAPLSLDAFLHRRVTELPRLARELLEIVAAAGRPTARALLTAAQRAGAPGDPEAEDSALATLKARHLIRTSGVRSEDQVETYHDRVRETVAAHLAGGRDRAVHRRLAVALEAAPGADAEELATHWHAAGEREAAARYAAIAASKAEEALAFDRAALFLRTAIECSEGARAEVTQPYRERLAHALKNAGRAVEAAAAYRAAAEGARPSAALDLRRRAVEQLLISGHLDEGLDLLSSVLGQVGMRLAASPSRALASVLAQRLFLRMRGLSYELRAPGSVREEDLTRIDACWSVAVGLSMVDNVRAADFQAKHLLLALRSGDLERITRALTFEVGFVAGPGSAASEASGELLRRAGELAARAGTPYALGFHTLMSGVRAYLAGRWKRAFEYAEHAERTLREQCSGLTWEVTNSQRFALGSLMYMGELPEALRRLSVLLRRAADRGNLYVATDLRTRIALPWLGADDPARLEHEIEDALARWTDRGYHLQHYNSLMALGQADLYTGRPERAKDRLARQAADLKRSMVLRMQVPRVEVTHLRARLSLAMASARRGSAAQELLREVERDIIAIEREAAPWAMPLARLLGSAAASARGSRASAVDLADRAARGFEAASMHLYAAAARHRLGELTGGEEGEALVSDARAWMAEHGVRSADRMLATLAPGDYR